jgi:hypothetical protein
MYTPEDITSCFDVPTLKYLQHKKRGGTSGQKGTRYEDHFATYQLTLLARAVLEGSQEINFLSQVLAFVDDLIIDNKAEPLYHYQLKNSSSISWTSDGRAIESDFERQYQLNQRQKGRDSRLYLVVADSDLCRKLQDNLPRTIQAFTQVIHFPYIPDIPKAAQHLPDFRAALIYLSAFDNPDPDKIEYVAKAVMGAWVTKAESQTSVKELLTKAQQVSPCYIRSFKQDLQLDAEVVKILAEIENFTYNLAKGFFHWQYLGGLQEGTPPFSIETEDFQRLQDRIKRQRPTTFEALEMLL